MDIFKGLLEVHGHRSLIHIEPTVPPTDVVFCLPVVLGVCLLCLFVVLPVALLPVACSRLLPQTTKEMVDRVHHTVQFTIPTDGPPGTNLAHSAGTDRAAGAGRGVLGQGRRRRRERRPPRERDGKGRGDDVEVLERADGAVVEERIDLSTHVDDGVPSAALGGQRGWAGWFVESGVHSSKVVLVGGGRGRGWEEGRTRRRKTKGWKTHSCSFCGCCVVVGACSPRTVMAATAAEEVDGRACPVWGKVWKH